MNAPQQRQRPKTYATFMRAMTGRLRAALPALTTRDAGDPSIALLDGWAMIADVLSFYHERIADEGYLRTAVEPRSLREFAALTGYRPRPGVAASVYLAYQLDAGGAVTLAPGSKAQSVPAPGQTAQTFEIADALDARDRWNVLPVRMSQPQSPAGAAPVYLATLTTNLKPNDLLLFVRPDAHRFVRIADVQTQPLQNRTKITLQGAGLVWDAEAAAAFAAPPVASALPTAAEPVEPADLLARLSAIEAPILQRASVPPRNSQRLVRTRSDVLGANLDIAPQLFGALHPDARTTLYAALAGAAIGAPPPLEVYAFRVHAAPYGHNAPAPYFGSQYEERADASDWPLALLDQDPRTLSLDARYDRIMPGSFIAVRTYPNDEPVLFTVTGTRERSRRNYGLAATTTVLSLDGGYFVEPGQAASLAPLREIDVYAQSERVQLVDVPIETDIPEDPQATPTVLELDGIVDGLAAGRWAIVTGERTDLAGVAGAELVMIAAAEHRPNPAVANDSLHTFVTLSARLAYRYQRSSVKVWGNVVRATHGETRNETIGSGDAAQSRQAFTLKAKPLTFVASATQSGARSSLTVRVNGVTWTPTDDLAALGPTDRAYATLTTEAGTTVIFGDGIHGARLPSGTENVHATYRTGLGSGGNVDAGSISLLMSRPLGVKAVVNPVGASGGADAEAPGDLRRNVPTALLALDRLVSLDDYATFSRTFAGVAKSAATRIGSGAGSSVFLTLAGAGNATIDPHGDLAVNLATALRALGDPRQAFALASCDRVIVLVGAAVDIDSNAAWETVEPAIRSALFSTFGFAARDIGQPAYRSEAIGTIQRVAGVVDVEIDWFAGVSAATLGGLATFAQRAQANDVIAPLPVGRRGGIIAPAQLVCADPAVRDTIVLRRRTSGAGA